VGEIRVARKGGQEVVVQGAELEDLMGGVVEEGGFERATKPEGLICGLFA